MALDADTLLDRIYLKSQIRRWRTIAIGILALLAIVLFSNVGEYAGISGSYIARINIQGIITDNQALEKKLEEIRTSSNAKAVILRLDTPGGTAVAGEELYLRVRAIAEKKPVVASMRTLCTSAGYMTAIAADHIFAREGTLTGSIGVIMQSMELTGLAKKLGITPITLKSGDFKGAPLPSEPITDAQRQMLSGVVNSYFTQFMDKVTTRRKLPPATVPLISEGRVMTGEQALKAKLIDAIGGEEEALAWLNTERGIDKDLPIRDVWPEQQGPSLFAPAAQWFGQFNLSKLTVPLDGLVLIWQGGLE